jgi:hypothetical protein
MSASPSYARSSFLAFGRKCNTTLLALRDCLPKDVLLHSKNRSSTGTHTFELLQVNEAQRRELGRVAQLIADKDKQVAIFQLIFV